MSLDAYTELVTRGLVRLLHKRRLMLALFGPCETVCMLHRYILADVATLGRLLGERDAQA